jgi:hypothetical protein
MAYPLNQTRPGYDDQVGPHLKVSSPPLLDITSWTPSRGTQETKFHVCLTTVCPLMTANSPIVFLMFGQRKCQASKQQFNQIGLVGSYGITADVPQFSSTSFPVSTVPVFIFMESEDGHVLSKVDVGTFTYGLRRANRKQHASERAKEKKNTSGRRTHEEPCEKSVKPAVPAKVGIWHHLWLCIDRLGLVVPAIHTVNIRLNEFDG